MAKLSKLKNRTRAFEVNVDGEVVKGLFYPGVYTPKFEEELNSIQEDDPEANRVLAKKLCALVAEWDLEEDDGSKVPISVEQLIDIPYDVLIGIMMEIGRNLFPNKKTSVSTGSFS